MASKLEQEAGEKMWVEGLRASRARLSVLLCLACEIGASPFCSLSLVAVASYLGIEEWLLMDSQQQKDALCILSPLPAFPLQLSHMAVLSYFWFLLWLVLTFAFLWFSFLKEEEAGKGTKADCVHLKMCVEGFSAQRQSSRLCLQKGSGLSPSIKRSPVMELGKLPLTVAASQCSREARFLWRSLKFKVWVVSISLGQAAKDVI